MKTKRGRKLLFFAFTGLHLSVALLFNLRALLPEPDTGSVEPMTSLQQATKDIQQFAPVYLYAQLSGLHGGYSFYAFRVGSQIYSYLTAYDTNGISIGETVYPGLHSTEAKLRYGSFLQVYQKAVSPSAHEKAWLNGLNLSLCRKFALLHEASTVELKIISPALQHRNNEEKQQYHLLHSHLYEKR